MTQAKPHVSFIGLGAMGFGMATNLVKEGYAVTGFDVFEATLERFRQAGGTPARTAAEAVAGKDYCVCMVATAQQAQAVLLGGDSPVAKALPSGATLLLCSTVPCAYVRGLERDLAAAGRDDVLLVDCPVSGGAARAADGTLSIMAAGSDSALRQGQDLLQAMSDPQKLYLVAGGVGAGSNMKMCHQVLAANQILAASEAMGFASRLGLDIDKAAAAVLASEGWSWMFEHRLPRMLDPNFQPLASAVTIILKDTSIITAEARRANFATPMTTTAEQVYFTGLGRGFGPDDDSSLIRLYTEGIGNKRDGVGPIPISGHVSEGDEERTKTALVIDLLKGIHLCSAAETISFAQHVGLDLDQVFDLCINAAGGSKMLSAHGPGMIKAFRDGVAGQGWAGQVPDDRLEGLADRFQLAVDEAQRLKVPLFLGGQALGLMRMALRRGGSAAARLSMGSVLKVWADSD